MPTHFSPAPPNPTIRVVHPCGDLRGPDPDHLRRGVRHLQDADCDVRWSPAAAVRNWGRRKLAGTDQERADELFAALTEPGVDIVWVARGGHGAARIMQRVLERIADAPPRIVIGFSDATTIINALAARGWPTVHGPVITSLSKSQPQVQLAEVLDVLTGQTDTLHFPAGPGPALRGRLFGGNLTVLSTICGLDLLPTAPDAIWLLEEIDEHPYAMDRAWTQLRLGPLQHAAGIWCGPLNTTVAADQAHARQILRDDSACPMVFGAPAGHTGPNAAIPLGIPVYLDPAQGTLRWQVEQTLA
jgi:muramoyltetrapeptide carboxypeptidase